MSVVVLLSVVVIACTTTVVDWDRHVAAVYRHLASVAADLLSAADHQKVTTNTVNANIIIINFFLNFFPTQKNSTVTFVFIVCYCDACRLYIM